MLVSPTSIDIFFECPYKWKLTYIDQKKPLPIVDKERLFGAMIHNMLKAYYDNLPENPSEEEISTTIEKVIRDYFDPTFQRREQRVRNIMENFKKFELQRVRRQKAKPDFVEKKFVYEPFSGVIDFYNSGEVIDWKVRGVSTLMTMSHIRQGKIYEYILKNNGLPVRVVRFFSLELGEFIAVPRVSDDWLMRQYQQMKEQINSGTFKKVIGNHCRKCEQILNCQFGEVSMWSDLE